MAVKTIIVGIGSEGYKVAERLVSKLESIYGDIDKVSWIRFIILETEKTSTRKLGKKGLSSHIGIAPQDFAQVQNSPKSYEPTIDLPNWCRLVNLGTSPPVDGANNNRVLGRLCFLFPTNFGQFIENLSRSVNDLTNLTAKRATEQLGTQDPDFVFSHTEKEGVRVDDINVFVVGTLTGGTGSGCFVDVGYAVSQLPTIRNRANVYGILSIPPVGHSNQIHMGNAYAALTELNHFHFPRAKYSAKLPVAVHYPGVTSTRSKTPFDYAFIIQPRSAGAEAIEQARSSVVELLFEESVDDSGNLVKSLCNAEQLEGPDRKGCPMSFYSLGASSIEFPVDHIIEGATSKLASELIQKLLNGPECSEVDFITRFRDTCQIEYSAFRAAVVNTDEFKGILDDWMRKAENAIAAKLKGESAAVNNWRHLVGSVTDSFRGTPPSAEAAQYLAAINKGFDKLIQQSVEKTEREVIESLLDAKRGPIWTTSFVRKLLVEVKRRRQEIGDPAIELQHHSEYKVATSQLDQGANAPQEKKGCNPFVKRVSNDSTGAFLGAARTFVLASVKVKCDHWELKLLQQIEERAHRWLDRLNGPEQGLNQWLREVEKRLNEVYKDHDSVPPQINGFVIFEPGLTIGAEIENCLSSEDSKRAADNSIREVLKSVFIGILKPANESRFDDVMRVDESDIDSLQRATGRFFDRLLKVNVADRLTGKFPDWARIVQDAMQKSKAFIEIDFRDNPLGPPPTPDPQRKPTVALGLGIKDAGPQTSVGRIGKEIRDSGFECHSSKQPHKIVFLQGLGIFSLSSIQGIEAAAINHDSNRHTRIDVAWRPLNGSPLDSVMGFRVGLVLTALALKIIKAVPGSGLVYVTQARPGHPASELHLSRELSEASYKLSLQSSDSNDLNTLVRKEIEKLGLTATANLLNTLSESADHYSLEYEGEPVGPDILYNRCLPFLDTVVGLVKAWHDLFPNYCPPDLDSYRRFNTPEKPVPAEGGYYCPACLVLLALPGDDPNEAIPKSCPNCNWRLRFEF